MLGIKSRHLTWVGPKDHRSRNEGEKYSKKLILALGQSLIRLLIIVLFFIIQPIVCYDDDDRKGAQYNFKYFFSFQTLPSCLFTHSLLHMLYVIGDK